MTEDLFYERVLNVLGRIAEALETGNRLYETAKQFEVAALGCDQIDACKRPDGTVDAELMQTVKFAVDRTLTKLQALVQP